MTIEVNHNLVYESPDNGKTIYAREPGSSSRHIVYVDPIWKREQALAARWVNLKEAVFMADGDPVLNDALSKLEMLYALKKEER